MSKERLFFTGSVRIIGDPRPSGLDLRVYACVSLHDGMSLHKGTGRGCYASFATLTAEIGCDAANLSRSLKRLVDWGYLTEERQEDRRRKAYRVTFPSRDSWSDCQQDVGENANKAAEIVGNGDSSNIGNHSENPPYYSSLKELDPPEGEKLNSDESARLPSRGLQEGSRIEPAGKLAIVERVLGDPDAGLVAIQECERTVDAILDECGSNYDPEDCTGSWAVRLSDRIAAKKHEIEVVHWLGSVEQFLAQHAAPLDPERARDCIENADRFADQDHLPEAVRSRAANLARAVQARLIVAHAGQAKRVRS